MNMPFYRVEELEPRLVNVIWKITLGCNFRCKHCGFSAGTPLDNELSSNEALDVCDQLIDLNAETVALSGGEPLSRKDWYKIAGRLTKGGVDVVLVTNGSMLNENKIKKSLDSGISGITVSLDGVEGDHDNIRKSGSFSKAVNAIKLAKNAKLYTNVISTLNLYNYGNLEKLFDVIKKIEPDQWQIQLTDCIGYMRENASFWLPESVLPELEKKIIALNKNLKKGGYKTQIAMGDNFGYFSEADKVFRKDYVGGCYTGCFAGIYVIGIESNGDVKGCPTLPDSFIEGNLRQRSLKEIFFNKKSFLYNRKFNQEKLKGFCRTCKYGETCRGGCISSRLGSTGEMTGNRYCTYQVLSLQQG